MAKSKLLSLYRLPKRHDCFRLRGSTRRQSPSASLDESLLEKKKKLRPQQLRQNHRPPSRRRQQAEVQNHRLQARQDGYAATVQTIEYDPNRSAFIALVKYEDGEKRYIIAPSA